jgi:hypothetical protein
MSELDFDREGTGHSMSHLRGHVPSAEDAFIRTTLLPRIWSNTDLVRLEELVEVTGTIRAMSLGQLIELSDDLAMLGAGRSNVNG